MRRKELILVGGTHGNELLGVHLVINGEKLFPKKELKCKRHFILANEMASANCVRYIDRDLNRCFGKFLKNDLEENKLESTIARKLLESAPLNNEKNNLFILDLHSTTSNMGMALVIMQNDPLSFAIACEIKMRFRNMPVRICFPQKLGEENSFLLSSFPRGILIEMGPIAQGTIPPKEFLNLIEVIKIVDDCLSDEKEVLLKNRQEDVFQIQETIDYPKEDFKISGMVHPNRWYQDFQSCKKGDPLFQLFNGKTLYYEGEETHPIFIGESAYIEKGEAFTLTQIKKVIFSKNEKILNFHAF